MATRSKTVEFAWDGDNTSVAAATARSTLVNAATLDIAENSSRVIRTAFLILSIRDTQTTAASMTSWSVNATIGGVASGAQTVTATPANTGEAQAFELCWDLTSHFNTNFGAGTTSTFSLSATFGGISTRVGAVKLIISYEYEDAAQTTRTKTIRIPLPGSVTGAGPSNLAVPDLSAYLVENTVSIKQAWFECYVMEGAAATTDATYTFSRSGASPTSKTMTVEHALTSACTQFVVYRQDNIPTSGTFNLTVAQSGVTVGRVCAVLCITYTYNHTSSTRICNSLLFTLDDLPGVLPTSSNPHVVSRKFFIEEPGTITQLQSGVLCTWNSAQLANVNLKAGTEAGYTLQTVVYGTLGCGYMAAVHAASATTFVNLARGENTFSLSLYAATANTANNWTGLLIINYTSDKHANGDGAHNHTVLFAMAATDTGLTATATASATRTFTHQAYIPETSFYLQSAGVRCYLNVAPVTDFFGLFVEKGSNAGFNSVLQSDLLTSSERQPCLSFARAQDTFMRRPNDPDTSRVDVETSRTWMFQSSIAAITLNAFLMSLTYHSIAYTVSGTVSGYTGDGSGISIGIHRSDNNELVATATTIAGGGYSAVVYDNVLTYYSQAMQGSNAGRSVNAAPT